MSADKLMLIVPVVLAVLALSAWGAMTGSAADGPPQPSPPPSASVPKPDDDDGNGEAKDGSIAPTDAEKARAAALRVTGGGTVRDIEKGDDGNPGWYEVEIQKPNGTEVTVQLDENFKQRAGGESENGNDQEGRSDD